MTCGGQAFQGWSQSDMLADETTVADTLKTAGGEATTDVKNAMDGVMEGDLDALMPLAKDYIGPAIGAIATLIVGYLAARFFSRIVSAPVRSRVDETLGRFAGKMTFYSIMTCVGIAVLSIVGIEVASFAAILAAAGFAIGMAFQGTLGNFAAGIMLLVFRPFKVGDVVNAAGTTGKINEIDLFTTTFDTPDNRRIIVPNSAVAGGIIENISHHEHRRVEVAVGCDYESDLRATRQALTQAAESLAEYMVSGDGRGYQVFLGTLGDSCVNWKVRFWTTAENYWPIHEALTEAVKNHLDAAGIGIPFPQMDIHIPAAAIPAAKAG